MREMQADRPPGFTEAHAIVRIALAAILLITLVWIVPTLAAEHARPHPPVVHPLDAFDRAGVNELRAGQYGPPFTLRTIANGVVGLHDFEDRLIVLNFWATWCQPCVMEMPTLEALAERDGDRGLVVLGIDVDRSATPPAIAEYARRLHLTFPILLDPDMKTASAWHVAALPSTFIVKPGGEVVAMAIGARAWDSPEMDALLDGLLPSPPTRNVFHR